jgi:outer membrane receptor protein involved in Fe transport
MKKKDRRLGAALGLAALTAGIAPLHAQPDPLATSEETRPDEPVEVSDLELVSLLELAVSVATKHAIPIADSPSTVSVATREQITDYGYLSLNSFLHALPGFTPSQDFEVRAAGFRGAREGYNNNRLMVLWDGLSQNEIEGGGAPTHEVTPLFFARTIEVVRGPASAVYGSNALHGVIAVETVTARDLGDGGVEARLRAGPGTQTFDAVGAQVGSWADAVVGVSAFKSDGDEYASTDDSYRTDEGGRLARFQVQDEQEAGRLWLKVTPHTASLEGLQLQIHHFSHASESGRGWLFWAPDSQERIGGDRTIVELTHEKKLGRLSLEQAAQYTLQGYDAQVRYYPAGAFDGYYPAGVTEVMAYDTQALFLRSQAQLDLDGGVGLLAGVEYSGLLYSGDDQHYANAQLVDETGAYPALDEYREHGSVYAPIEDRPVHKMGMYAQAVSGKLLGERLELTLGARGDVLAYRHQVQGIAESEAIGEISPRAGLVWRAHDTARFKLMAGRAYRTPTISELFATNTWSSNSNPHTLEAERATTLELAADWAPASPVRLRGNAFFIDHDNVVDYVLTDSVFTIENVYSDRRAGAEAEAIVEKKLGPVHLDAFASYSYVRLIDEEVNDPMIGESEVLVWSPSHMIKGGVRASSKRIGGTLLAYAQSKTRRRTSDRMDESFRDARPFDLPGWFNLDASLFVRARDGIRLGVEAHNLLGTAGGLVAPGAHSFDYRMPATDVLGTLGIDL